MKKNRVFSFKYFLFDFIRITAIPALLVFRPKAKYISDAAKKKIKGGALVMSNHIGFADPVYLMVSLWYRRHHFIAMEDLLVNKFLDFLFHKAFLAITISRENFTLDAFRKIVDHLQNEELITMFPEGRINREENVINPFKPGIVLMAQKSGKPIIPVYMKKKNHFYDRLIYAVGEPYYVDSSKCSIDDLGQVCQELYQKELDLQALCNSK